MLTRRHTTYWLAGLTVAIVAAATIFGRQRIEEEWYLYQLRSDDQAVVDNAAMRLGESKSTRAILPLVALLPTEIANGRRVYNFYSTNNGDGSEQHLTNSRVFKALYDIGEPVKRAVSKVDWEAEKIAEFESLLDLPRLDYDPAAAELNDSVHYYREARGFQNSKVR